MGHMTPRVYAHWLEDPAVPGTDIRLDSLAWFAWLEAPTTTRFAYPIHDPRGGYIVGVMTVRKERRQRGGWYWSVYRRIAGGIRKHYLGRSSAVTAARLTAIAAQLLAEASPPASDSSPETPRP
jgi:LuxR family maltose regulon positive regulatory protein